MTLLSGLNNAFVLNDKYPSSAEDRRNAPTDFSAYMAEKSSHSDAIAEVKVASAEKIAAHNASVVAAIDVPDPKQQFMDFMEGTSEEIMREQILLSLGLTEEELEALPPEERMAIEKKIAAIIEEKVQMSLERQMSESTKEEDQMEI